MFGMIQIVRFTLSQGYIIVEELHKAQACPRAHADSSAAP